MQAQEVVSDVKGLMLGKGLPKKNGLTSSAQGAPRSVSPGVHPTPGVNVREQVFISKIPSGPSSSLDDGYSLLVKCVMTAAFRSREAKRCDDIALPSCCNGHL